LRSGDGECLPLTLTLTLTLTQALTLPNTNTKPNANTNTNPLGGAEAIGRGLETASAWNMFNENKTGTALNERDRAVFIKVRVFVCERGGGWDRAVFIKVRVFVCVFVCVCERERGIGGTCVRERKR